MKRITALVLMLLLLLSCTAEVLEEDLVAITEESIVEYGEAYDTKEEVALYLHVFQQLPVNYLTKEEARELGWDSSKGNLWDVAPDMSIGGDRFGNREEILPDEDGRQWYECDLLYEGGRRNAYRLVFSNDGLIYYTEDHYQTFDLLYDGWYDEEYWLNYPEYLEDEDFECYVDYEGDGYDGKYFR